MRPSLVAVIVTLSSPFASAWPLEARVVAAHPGPVQARVGEPVSLSAVLVNRRGVNEAVPVGSTVRWFQVEPRREHVDHPSPNAGLTSFSNAVLFGPRHGHWIGYDRLEYTQSEVTNRTDLTIDGATLTLRGAHPTDATFDTHGGAGSTWFAAEITLADGRVVRTPDASSVDRLGLVLTVQRVSFRADDTFLGWLGTFFHVTSVFASNGPTDGEHQGDRYTGADCADVLVAAWRASGNRAMHYTSVSGIGTYARALTSVLRIDASGIRDARGDTVALRWGGDVTPGDLVTIDYADDPRSSLPRSWDHIGALVRDGNGDGVLDGEDVLRHMGGHGLEDTPLDHGGPMRIVVWRWRSYGQAGALVQ